MPIRRAFRFTAEGALLVLAVALVAAVCVPLWQWTAGTGSAPRERWSRLLLGPEQLACYVCFVWAGFILLTRALEIRRQRAAFSLDLLPLEDDARILPEDARLWQRRVNRHAQRRGPTLLGHLIDLALAKFAVSRSPQEAGTTVREAAELEQARLVASLSTVHYLAWAIPAIGFVGTARGIGMALSVSPALADESLQQFLDQVTRSLAVTFDTTLVALALSVVIMFFVHMQQRAEESLVLDAQQYCLEHLQGRLVTLPPATAATAAPPPLPEPTYREPSVHDLGHGLGGLA